MGSTGLDSFVIISFAQACWDMASGEKRRAEDQCTHFDSQSLLAQMMQVTCIIVYISHISIHLNEAIYFEKVIVILK